MGAACDLLNLEYEMSILGRFCKSRTKTLVVYVLLHVLCRDVQINIHVDLPVLKTCKGINGYLSYFRITEFSLLHNKNIWIYTARCYLG